MAETVMKLTRGVFSTTVILLGIVAVLLFVLLAIAMRPLLIVLTLSALLVAAGLYHFSATVRRWFDAAGKQLVAYRGLNLATDVEVYSSHSWVRRKGKDVEVGADDLVQATLGPADAVDLPPLGLRVEQGDPLFTLRHGDRTVRVLAPVSGTVVVRNAALLRQPQLINEHPFGDGWAVQIREEPGQLDRQHLLEGRQARGWYGQEVNRLIATLSARVAVADTVSDDAILAPDFYRQIDGATWKRLTETFFGEGSLS